MTSAIVFVATQYLLTDAHRCINHCIAHGYHMVGLVKDDWGKAMEYLHEGKASVLVIADPEHLDPDREPRIEIVADEEKPPADPTGRQIRTSRITRPNAEA